MKRLRNFAPLSVQQSDRGILQIFLWKYIPAGTHPRLRKSRGQVMPNSSKSAVRPR